MGEPPGGIVAGGGAGVEPVDIDVAEPVEGAENLSGCPFWTYHFYLAIRGGPYMDPLVLESP